LQEVNTMRFAAIAFMFVTLLGGCAGDEELDGAAPADEPVAVDESAMGIRCGENVCARGTYCCNPSCGQCVPCGIRCPQVVCESRIPPPPFPPR
jgi:hypothetical protein